MNTLYPRLSPSPPSSPSWRSSLWPSNPTSNGGTATRSQAAARAIEADEARAVEVSGIRKGFGGQAPALDGVDLTVEAGELLALLGPSGSGKTTLLRVIAGLEIPDTGRVLFGGRDVTDVAVQEREIGFVFQHYALFRHLSVFDNVAYGLRARRRTRPPEPVIRERVSTLLDLVQLGALAKRHPAQLSGGQRQRVALARAIATNPRILLLDEPFGALDARVRKDLRRWLREIHRETGQTTIFVTHDQDEALELADRVAILNRGRIEQVGTPDVVHDHPASAFVAGFVGDGVQIPVTIAGGAARFGSRALTVPASGLPDGPAMLFLRARDIALGEAGQGSLDGMVRDVRRVGNGRRVDVQIDDLLLDVEIAAHVEPPAIGAPIGLLPSGGRIFAHG